MIGVVPILVLLNQASVDTFLYLSLNVIGQLFRSRTGAPTDLVTQQLGLPLEVQL